MNTINELSIFIDEAGDVGVYDDSKNPISDRYYLITLVFHDQNQSIEPQVEFLRNRLEKSDFTANAIHSGPLIRKEPPFRDYKSEDVFRVLQHMLYFLMKSPIRYYVIAVDKTKYVTREALEFAITNQIMAFINMNYAWLSKFKKIKIYYDNGQKIVSESIRNSFCSEFECKMNCVKPGDYFLFQVADFICTFNLIEIKRQKSQMSNSEKRIFSPKKFKKMFFSEIEKKRM